jgi:hypothetical protein
MLLLGIWLIVTGLAPSSWAGNGCPRLVRMTPRASMVVKLTAACLLCLAVFAGLTLLVTYLRRS